MKHSLRLHLLALGNSVSQLAATPLASLLNALVIGIAIALPLGLFSVLGSVEQLARQWPGEPALTVFFYTTSSPADVQRVEALLKRQNDVVGSRHIDKDSALRELAETSGMQNLIAGLGQNPLPDALAITLRQHDIAALERIAATAKTDPAVELVQLDSAWAKRLSSLLDLGQRTVELLTLLFGGALVLIAGNTIRMQILSRREEIEVSKLIGATDAFIRRPFLYFALLQGLLGAAVGVGLVALALWQLNPAVGALAREYGSQFQLHLTDADALASTFALVSLLSLAGAWLSVRQQLSRML